MILFLSEIFADKSVLAHEAKDERFSTQTFQAHFTIGNDKTRLNDIANFYFCLNATINDMTPTIVKFNGILLRPLTNSATTVTLSLPSLPLPKNSATSPKIFIGATRRTLSTPILKQKPLTM